MADPHPASPLFERLITLSQEAFDARHYDTAYYLLAATLHEADGDAQRCVTVHRVAEAFLGWVARVDPAYAHSARSAATRVRTSLFALLAAQAQVKRLMAEREHHRDIALPSHPEEDP